MRNKGQSTVEYILLVTAVLLVVIYFVTGSNSVFQNRLMNVLNQTSDDMVQVSNRLSGINQNVNQ